MARAVKEEFRVLFLDRKNVLIADEVQNSGTLDHTPSRTDIALTREIVAAAKPLKIAIHDHLVVGRSGHASFKSQGLL